MINSVSGGVTYAHLSLSWANSVNLIAHILFREVVLTLKMIISGSVAGQIRLGLTL